MKVKSHLLLMFFFSAACSAAVEKTASTIRYTRDDIATTYTEILENGEQFACSYYHAGDLQGHIRCVRTTTHGNSYVLGKRFTEKKYAELKTLYESQNSSCA